MIYEYDGSFFGYLSAVFDAWHDGLGQVEDIRCGGSGSLFSDVRFVDADMTKVRRIVEGLRTQCGARAGHFLYYAFLAEEEGREMTLLAYLRRAFCLKENFLHHLSEPLIWDVRQWARKTGNERHKLLGLLRFRELEGGMLYGAVAPSCCVVPVMAPHFLRRLPQEEWVIHDVRRRFGVYYDRRSLTIVEIPHASDRPGLSPDEEQIAVLWQQYYRTIAISQRRNEKLRRQFMPKKYWKYLIEMERGGPDPQIVK